MFIIDSAAALARALDQPLDTHLRTLLTTRADQLGSIDGAARFHVTQACDGLDAIKGALGFPITINLVDGIAYPDPDYVPSWEYVDRHAGGWMEITFILSDHGPAEVLLVQDAEDGNPDLMRFLRKHAVPAVKKHRAEPA